MACVRSGLLAAVVLATAAAASAQTTGPPYESARTARVTGGGEFAGIFGPPDDIAFFNFTDYGSNALRLVRLRLFGEWRPAPRLSFIGEVRIENGREVDLAALYVRWLPLASRSLEIRAGRVPPLVGAFPRRAYGRDNFVLGTPLAFQYVTSLRSDALPSTIDDLLRMRGRGWQPSYPIGSSALAPGVPMVSTADWDTGLEASWRHDGFDASLGFTQGAPAVPVVRDRSRGWQWSGRVSAALKSGLTIGASAAHGAWLDDDVAALVAAPGVDARDQTVAGVEIEYGRGPFLARAEWLASRFSLPLAEHGGTEFTIGTQSGYVEARYRVAPRADIAMRLDRLTFSPVTGSNGVPTSWDAQVDRVEAVASYRVNRHFDLRAGWQHNWRPAGRVHRRGYPVVAVLFWF